MTDVDRPIVVTVEPGGPGDSGDPGNNDELEPPAFLIRGVRSLLDEGYCQILLDVAKLTSVDSLLLAAIVQVYVSAVKRGATVKLLNPPKRLRDLMMVTKIDTVIESVTT